MSSDKTPGAHSDLQELLTPTKLHAWAAAAGLDLHDRDQLIRAAAVGYTVTLWRNTPLEDAHTGNGTPQPADVTTLLDHPLETHRIQLLLDAHAAGAGIPDDVMLRANASVAADIRDTLDHALPHDTATLSTAETSSHLEALEALLSDPHHRLRIGRNHATTIDLITTGHWDAYQAHLSGTLARAETVTHVTDPLRAVQITALYGYGYAAAWYPNPHWATGVASLREHLTHPAPDTSDVGAQSWNPDVDDQDFWDTLSTEPYLLDGRGARWVIGSRIRDHLTAARQAARHQLAQDEEDELNPTLLMLLLQV